MALRKSVRYIPAYAQGTMETKYLTKIAKIWRESTAARLEKELQNKILEDWRRDLVSLNIDYEKCLELDKEFGYR